MKPKTAAFAIILFFGLTQQALARGGGGGSGGGGGGGGFSSGGSGGGGGNPIIILIIWGVIITFSILGAYIKRKQLQAREKKEENLLEAEHEDAAAIKTRVADIFYKFESGWSNFDLPAIQAVTTENYYKRMVLELNVLKNEGRQDLMNQTKLLESWIYNVAPDPQGRGDAVVVRITGSAQDELRDTINNRQLFYDTSSFTEYWHLVKINNEWRLDLITQETENSALVENEISTFAKNNNFYFDPDFGWLMMPNKGVLFNQTDFGKSDINNHVIGYFRDKIVEFYTYIPNPNSSLKQNYLVAQTVLPKSYIDILIKKKSFLTMPVFGLKRQQLESADFNNKFAVWADPKDQINSLELLTPNFMEKIYQLPFDLNIEIVGNFLYFYTKGRGTATYDQMLQIISWAFDEMKK